MKKLALAVLAIALLQGCTFYRNGSQAVSFDPMNVGSGQPVVSPANDSQFWNGAPMNMRR